MRPCLQLLSAGVTSKQSVWNRYPKTVQERTSPALPEHPCPAVREGHVQKQPQTHLPSPGGNPRRVKEDTLSLRGMTTNTVRLSRGQGHHRSS